MRSFLCPRISFFWLFLLGSKVFPVLLWFTGDLGSDSSLLLGFLIFDGRGFVVATTGWHTLVLFPWISLFLFLNFLFFQSFSAREWASNPVLRLLLGVSLGLFRTAVAELILYNNVRQIANGTYMYPIVYRRIQESLFFHISDPVSLSYSYNSRVQRIPITFMSKHPSTGMVWYILSTKNAKSPSPLPLPIHNPS